MSSPRRRRCRRIRKTVDSDANGTPDEYRYNVHQGDELYMEVTDPDGLADETQGPAVAHRYLYGPAVDQVLAVEDAAADGGEFRGHEPILAYWERFSRFPAWLD